MPDVPAKIKLYEKRFGNIAIEKGFILKAEEMNETILKTIVQIAGNYQFGKRILTECQTDEFIVRYMKMLNILETVSIN